jgi:WD40 repeat protein
MLIPANIYHPKKVLGALAISPDGTWLAGQSLDPWHVSLWDVSSGKLKRTIGLSENNYGHGFDMALSPDGRLVASVGSENLGLKVWRIDNGHLMFWKPKEQRTAVTFSPGGILVGTLSLEHVQLFDARNGKELAHIDDLNLHADHGIAFSPDGRFLAVVDGTKIKLWDIFACRNVHVFKGHKGWVTSVAFAPEGKSLVSTSEDGTALVWDLHDLLPPGTTDVRVGWHELCDADRLKVYAAYCRLRASPEATLKLLKEKLKPTEVLPVEQVKKLIKQLDSDSFAEREKASHELTVHALAAESSLRRAVQEKPTLEVARRIARLLRSLDTGADWQRIQLVLALLEELPSPATRALLRDLARGNPDSRLTREAKAILNRIAKRGPEPKP